MQKTQLVLPFFIFLFLFLSSNAYAMNLTYAKVLDDSMISQINPTDNYGTGAAMHVRSYTGGYNLRIYIKFDPSTLPSNAVIRNANLSLYASSITNAGMNYIAAYNTSNDWSEENLTWAVIPTTDELQENLTINTSTTGGNRWVGWNITKALQNAVDNGVPVSIMIKDSVENSSTNHYLQFNTKEHPATTQRPYLEVNYSISDCVSDCGGCGCAANSTECYVPPIIGSYCDNEDGAPNTIKTVFNSTCVGTTYLTCPNGTVCNQITPLVNMSVYPTTPGEANLPYCHQCIFLNMRVATYFGAPTYTWVNVWTNCPNNPECNCQGYLCSNNIYEAPTITDTPYNITQWAAGCFNPSSGYFVNVTNSTGQQTTIDTLVNDSCGLNCTFTNSTPQTSCPLNTTSNCYDSACNPVQCLGAPSSVCSSNYGGELALSIGSLMGITDCGLSQWLLSIISAISVGFIALFYTKESQHSGQAFIFGTLAILIMFTLVGWFPSWLMVIMIIISGYLMAKSLGIGGGG